VDTAEKRRQATCNRKGQAVPKTITKIVYTFQELLDLNKAGRVSKKAVEKARSWLQEAATDFDWYSCVLDFWEPALDQIGFENAKISFSGFWSQGDGASFTAAVDLDKLVAFLADTIEPKDTVEVVEGKEQFLPYIVQLIGGKATNLKYRRLLWMQEHIQDIAVERTSHHYSHERTCRFTASLNDQGHYEDTLKPSDKWRWVSDTPKVRALFTSFGEDAENLRLSLCRAIYKMLEEDYWDRISDEQLLDLAEANDYTFEANGNRDG
jgi:hypothetical protein